VCNVDVGAEHIKGDAMTGRVIAKVKDAELSEEPMRNLGRSRAWTPSIAAFAGIVAVALAATAANSAPTTALPLSLCDPATNTFTTTVDNPFFPLPAGQQWVYVGKEGSQNIGLQITVLSGTERFYQQGNDGVPTVNTVRVEEKEWEDDDGDGVIDPGEFVIETSINYYAQTTGANGGTGGTVCYFGEDVEINLPGGGTSSEGAWRADGAPDHAPGIFMPALADIAVGASYPQEVAPGLAEDTATIIAEDRSVKTPAATFTDTITTRDFNPLDGSRGTKSYASSVGLIQDGPLLLKSCQLATLCTP
jgi:hypothetical protein